MGSNKGPNSQYGSGGDPRGRIQNQSAHQQDRYENQQGPMVSAFANNYGRGSEANYGDYTDIMNQYRNIASGGGANDGGGDDGGGGGGGGGGGEGGGYEAYTVSPGRASYNDPFKSYAGMEQFSNDGGYSRTDVANMRSRGVSPIRAAYANAEREQGRSRALQGGYSPNAFAASAKMAREQGQSAADATNGVEAGLAEARNRGRQFGLTGMSNIEGQRLDADVDLSKFNTGMDFEGQKYNADAYTQANARNVSSAQSAGQANADRSAASAAASRADQLRALSGMTQLYGTTPGMSNTFGNQLLQGVGQGGQFGLGLIGADVESQKLPGQYDQTMGRTKDMIDMGSRIANPILDYYSQRKKNQNTGVMGPTNNSDIWAD
jgi:hypothetical protein